MDRGQASDAVTGKFRKGTVLYLSDPDACNPERWECPSDFRAKYIRAREAIENGHFSELKAAVQSMKQETCPGVPREHCLDICFMIPYSNDLYPMTLLAFAGYHTSKEMLDLLIHEGANVDMGNRNSGTPLLQLLAYCVIQEKQDQLDINIVQFFIDKGAVLSRVLTAGTYIDSTALEFAINLHRLDVAKMLVEAGVDPILGGDPEVSPIFIEYAYFGSHKFIKWLLGEHLAHKIPAFINGLLDEKVFSNHETYKFAFNLGRNVAHAFLLSGQEEAIHCLLDKKPDLLMSSDPFNKSALHLAAEKGDCDSVRILLERNAAVDAKDEDSMTPIMLAAKNGHTEVITMVLNATIESGKESADGASERGLDPMELWQWALQYGYTAYFEAMHGTGELENLLMSPLDNDDNTIAHLAALGGHVAVFKSIFPKTHQDPNYEDFKMFLILTKKNKQKKTPLQLAIERGNISILYAPEECRAQRKKQESENVLYPQPTEAVDKFMWQAVWEDENPKLLLYSCIHGTVEIVKYFIAKSISPTTRRKRYTPLACAAKAGNYDIIAFLLSIKGVSPEGIAIGKEEESRSSVATGQEDEKPYSPLMLASMSGHADCVTFLLEKEADIGVKSKSGYNCLMEAIKAGHEDVATAILSHHRWKDTMKLYTEEKRRGKIHIVTPMRMLIKTMPDVAEMVLTNCLRKGQTSTATQADPEAGKEVVKNVFYDYQFIEDYCELPVPVSVHTAGTQIEMKQPAAKKGKAYSPRARPPSSSSSLDTSSVSSDEDLVWLEDTDGPDEAGEAEDKSNTPSWGPKGYFSLQHPLTLMVNHERLKLLQHPLISRYIEYKWWRVVFPLLVFYLLLYVVFLIFLTSFAVSVPRPGPDNQYCPTNHSGPTYVELNFKDDECKDPGGVQKRSFTALAVLLILLSIVFLLLLVLEVGFRLKSLKLQTSRFDICFGFKLRMLQTWCEIFVRTGVFFLTIIYVFGFWNDCWCAPPWQWQIGALAVFLAYISIILLLKGMPVVGVPITMLLNIVITFLKLIYLPVLLIFAFAIPFYMLFVHDSIAVLDEAGRGTLEAFSTPAHSMAKVVMQTAGDLDYEIIFNEADLLYSPMAYLLFFFFVVLMPILFSNLLVGLAVGTTEKDEKKATFTNIKTQVNYIVSLENVKPLRRLGELRQLEYRKKHNANPVVLWLDKLRGIDYKTQKRLVDDKCNDILDKNKKATQVVNEKVMKTAVKIDNKQEKTAVKIDSMEEKFEEATQVLKEKVTKTSVKMDDMQERFAVLERNQKQLHESLEANMQALQSSIEQLLKK